jgi:hypothetical protein
VVIPGLTHCVLSLPWRHRACRRGSVVHGPEALAQLPSLPDGSACPPDAVTDKGRYDWLCNNCVVVSHASYISVRDPPMDDCQSSTCCCCCWSLCSLVSLHVQQARRHYFIVERGLRRDATFRIFMRSEQIQVCDIVVPQVSLYQLKLLIVAGNLLPARVQPQAEVLSLVFWHSVCNPCWSVMLTKVLPHRWLSPLPACRKCLRMAHLRPSVFCHWLSRVVSSWQRNQ